MKAYIDKRGDRKNPPVFEPPGNIVFARPVASMRTDLGEFAITSEETRFRFAADHTAWWIPDDPNSDEFLWNETPLSHIPGANTPVTMRASDGTPAASIAGVSTEEGNSALVATAIELFGGVDVAWANAGIPQPYRPIAEIDVAEFDRVFAINLTTVSLSAE